MFVNALAMEMIQKEVCFLCLGNRYFGEDPCYTCGGLGFLEPLDVDDVTDTVNDVYCITDGMRPCEEIENQGLAPIIDQIEPSSVCRVEDVTGECPILWKQLHKEEAVGLYFPPMKLTQGGCLSRDIHEFRTEAMILVGGTPPPKKKYNRPKGKTRPKARMPYVGNALVPPRVEGANQPSQRLRGTKRIERKLITGTQNLTSSAGGAINWNMSTLLFATPAANPAWLATPDVTSLASYSFCRIEAIEILYSPIMASTTAAPPMLFAYFPERDIQFAPTDAQMLSRDNHGQFDPRFAADFTYRILRTTSSEYVDSQSGAEIMKGGWISSSLFSILDRVATVVGPGLLTITGTGFPVSTLVGRVQVNFLVACQFRS
jgi:hypothetical protein